MTIQAKHQLLQDIEGDIGEYLTAVNTRRVLGSVDAQLDNYNIEEIRQDFKGDEDDILKAYIEAKTIEGRSPKTINRYSYILERMITAIGKPVRQIGAADIRAYLAAEKGRGLSGRSLEAIRQVASAFFNWSVREGLISKNPMGNIGAIKFTKEIKTPFTPLELEQIKNACTSDRDTALVNFLLTTGCRISEVCGLMRKDINFQSLEVKVLGKGDKERIVYLTEVSAAVLKKYLDNRTDDDPYLFMGLRGPFTPQGCRALLKRIELKCGVPNIHPHRFRRTLATHLIDRGMPIQEVAHVLGHAKIDTTMTYVFISESNVKNAYKKFF